MLTKKDLANIKQLMDEQINGVKGQVNGIKDQMDDMKNQMNDMKNQMDDMKGQISSLEGEVAVIKENMVTQEDFNGLKQVVYEWKDYSHNKFIMIENEVLPKISTLYEMTDFYVKQMECKKHREQAEKKIDCIEPLKTMASMHSEQLAKHDDILENLITGAV